MTRRARVRTRIAQIADDPTLENVWFGSQAAYVLLDGRIGGWRLDGSAAALRTKLGQMDEPALGALGGSFLEGTLRIAPQIDFSSRAGFDGMWATTTSVLSALRPLTPVAGNAIVRSLRCDRRSSPRGHRTSLVQDERLQTLRTIGAATARSAAEEDLPPLPARPTLADILTLRLHKPKFGLPFAAAPHGVQCASLAMRAGVDEETVLACLLHDVGMAVLRPDHGWWGAQLVEPYVSERVSWAIRYHQALRYFPDPEAGYEYPELYVQMFGRDYQPPEYLVAAHQYARGHRWYITARHLTLFDDYSFDPNAAFSLDPFLDIIGRHFRQPAEGLGNDNSPTAHMWRTIIDPNKPL